MNKEPNRFDELSAAANVEGLSYQAKLLLVILAVWDGGRYKLTRTTSFLCRKACMPRSTLKKAMRELEEDGLVKITRTKKSDQMNEPNSYSVNWPAVFGLCHSVTEGGSGVTEGGSQENLGGVTGEPRGGSGVDAIKDLSNKTNLRDSFKGIYTPKPDHEHLLDDFGSETDFVTSQSDLSNIVNKATVSHSSTDPTDDTLGPLNSLQGTNTPKETVFPDGCLKCHEELYRSLDKPESVTADNHFRMQVRNSSWFMQLRSAGCAIGEGSWNEWAQGIIDTGMPLADFVSFAKTLKRQGKFCSVVLDEIEKRNLKPNNLENPFG